MATRISEAEALKRERIEADRRAEEARDNLDQSGPRDSDSIHKGRAWLAFAGAVWAVILLIVWLR